MKRHYKRDLLLIFGFILVLLLFLPIRDFLTKAEADNTSYTIRILEVTDNGSTDLAGLTSGGNPIQIDTMSMKRFVSLRTDLDGKYDAIYIGSGKYNKSGVAGKDHNTSTVMNDITRLKAKAIIDHFINKGLYVFLHTDPFTNRQPSEQGNLYNAFNEYRTSTKSNVIFVNTNDVNKIVQDINKGSSPYLPGMKQRPRLDITNRAEIKEYTTSPNHIYQIGDELTYKIRVSNVADFKNRPVTANLYMSVDKSFAMSKDQIVASTTLDQGPNGEIKYKLPKTYSGVLYWKLEIVDQLNPNQWKDYDSGSIRFRGKKTVVSILQVLPNNEGNRSSSLLNTANMNPSFLKNDDYELKIETKSIQDFNRYIASNYSSNQTYGLNGIYDMIIFGFADIYNTKTPISAQAADAVVEFIEKTKQSVMFTHDTIYASTAEWMSKFQSITGQIRPETNLGLNAPNTSKLVAPVNDGLLTQYPFNLSITNDATNKPINQVATTHNQYFTLNLEDEEVIPWYNIQGNNRDINDSWNHYYTYSKGNVTYSGTGHIFTGNNSASFPDWEQRLFVNTMYRAFTGANHAPEITVLTPEDKSVKPSYQEELVVSYTVDDWDWKDRNLLTSIKFKKDNVYLSDMSIHEKAILSGQTVTQSFKNPLPEGGNLEIEISARDKQGAMSTKTIHVTIKKVTVNLETNRSLSDNVIQNEVKRDDEVVISYTVTPKPVPYLDVDVSARGKDKLVISDIQFMETFPANFEILEMPEGTIKTGTLDTGYVLHQSLGDIAYKLTEVNGIKSYVPEERQLITFQVKGTPKAKGVYLLANSKIDYEDIHVLPEVGDGQGTEAPEGTASNTSLGLPKDFSMFVLNNINISNFTNEGVMAGGGNVSISGFGVGTGLDRSYANKYTVIAGKHINVGNGSFGTDKNEWGKAAYGGTATTLDYLKHLVIRDSPIDFTAIRRNMLYTSEAIAKLPATGETKFSENGGILTLIGDDPKLNVFHVTGEKLKLVNTFTIEAPAASTVIVNIDGTHVEMGRGLSLKGVDAAHVLYNFHQASTVSNVGIEVLGTVLAPKAAYRLQGNIIGSVIVDSMSGGGYKIFLKPFEGDIGINPTEPESPQPRPRIPAMFPDLVFKAVVKVTEIQLSGRTILVDTEQQLSPVVLPEDADNKMLGWESLDSSIVSVTNEGTIHGLKEGTTEIRVFATDGSNVSTIVQIKVINRNLTITGPNTAKVRDELDLSASYVTVDEQVTGYRWSVKPMDGHDVSDMVRIVQDEADPSKVKVTALKKGRVTLIATVLTNKFPKGAMSREHTITISQRLDEIFIDGPQKVLVGENITLKVLTNPAGVENTGYQWSLVGDGATYAKIVPAIDGLTATVTGLKQHDAIRVQVTTNWPSDNLTATKDIKVVPVLTGLRLEGVTIKIHETANLFDDKLTALPSDFMKSELRGKLDWTSSDESIVTIDQNGIITGKKKGIAQITVTYINAKNVKITAKGTVKVLGTSSTDKY